MAMADAKIDADGIPTSNADGGDVAGERSPDAIQREIEQTRAELADTIDAIADRISPKRAASRGAQAVRAQVSSRRRPRSSTRRPMPPRPRIRAHGSGRSARSPPQVAARPTRAPVRTACNGGCGWIECWWRWVRPQPLRAQ
jgi:hypothetical protein